MQMNSLLSARKFGQIFERRVGQIRRITGKEEISMKGGCSGGQ